MYKLSITTLEGFKEALENSNKVLYGLSGTNDSLSIQEAIRKNETAIRILTEQYYIGKTTNSNE